MSLNLPPLPPEIHEWLTLWPAYCELADYLCSGSPREIDPHDAYGAFCAHEPDRCAAYLYGRHLADSPEEAEKIMTELLDLAREGRRPRYAAELGIQLPPAPKP